MRANDTKPWGSLSWPNRISLLRLLLVAPFIVLIMNQGAWGSAARYGAVAIFVSMAFSDVVDGILARRLNQKTRLGAILDPLADKVLIISAAVLLSLPQYAPAGARLADWVVVAIVGKDLWVIIGFLVVYLVTDQFRVHPSGFGKACTVAQVAMVVSVLLAPEFNQLRSSLGTWIAAVMGWVVAALCVLAVIGYTRMGLGFVIQEDKPLDSDGRKSRSDASD